MRTSPSRNVKVVLEVLANTAIVEVTSGVYRLSVPETGTAILSSQFTSARNAIRIALTTDLSRMDDEALYTTAIRALKRVKQSNPQDQGLNDTADDLIEALQSRIEACQRMNTNRL